MSRYLSDDYEEYIKDHYGSCKSYDPKIKGSCLCLVGGSRGRFCPNWEPVKEKSFKEMIERCKTDERYNEN